MKGIMSFLILPVAILTYHSLIERNFVFDWHSNNFYNTGEQKYIYSFLTTNSAGARKTRVDIYFAILYVNIT